MIFFAFFVHIVEARMRTNTQQTIRGAGDKRGGGGKDKTVGTRDIRSMEGSGMGWGTCGIQDGHHGDFQDLTRLGTFGKEGREFEGGGFGVD